MRIQTLVGFQAVEVSSRQGEKQFDLEPQRYRSKKLQGHTSAQQKVGAGAAVRLSPRDWDDLERTGAENCARER